MEVDPSLPGSRGPSPVRGAGRDSTEGGAVDRDDVVSTTPVSKRGRPATTGFYVGLAKAKEEARRQEIEDQEYRLSRLVVEQLEGATAVIARAGECGGIGGIPTADLIITINSSADAVLGVAKSSKNLKGTYVKSLKVGAINIKAAAEELVARIGGSESVSAKEGVHPVCELVARLKASEDEVLQLKEKIRKMEERPVPFPGPIPEPPKERRPLRLGRAVRRAPAFEDEEMEWWEDSPPPPLPVDVEVRTGALAVESALEGFEKLLEARLSQLVTQLDERYARSTRENFAAVPAPVSGESLSAIPPGTSGPPQGAAKPKKKKGGAGKKPVIVSDVRVKGPDRPRGVKDGTGEGIPPPSERSVSTPAIGEETAARGETWATVAGRRRKPPPGPGGPGKTGDVRDKGVTPGAGPSGAVPRPKTIRRPPRTEAVVITCPEGEYADVIGEARKKISLADIGIAGGFRVARTRTGAMAWRLSGQERKEKADTFASRLREVLAEREGVKVSRPVLKTEFLVTGLDFATTSREDVLAAIVAAGGCSGEDVGIGTVRVNPLSRMATAWVRCPIQAANTILKKGRLLVGWASVAVLPLAPRPMQCFRCLGRGHVQVECRSEHDRSTRCYRCGGEGHRARTCRGEVSCPLCQDYGRPAAHRMGSEGCPSAKEERKQHSLRARLQKKKQEKKKEGIPPPVEEEKKMEVTLEPREGMEQAGPSGVPPASREKRSRNPSPASTVRWGGTDDEDEDVLGGEDSDVSVGVSPAPKKLRRGRSAAPKRVPSSSEGN